MSIRSPERLLWLAVLGEQLNLALRERDPMGLKGKPDSARGWIGTRDFREVCELAGLEPDFVAEWCARQISLPLSERGMEQIALRCVSSGANQIRHRGRQERTVA